MRRVLSYLHTRNDGKSAPRLPVGPIASLRIVHTHGAS